MFDISNMLFISLSKLQGICNIIIIKDVYL